MRAFQRAKFSLDKESKLNNRKEVVDVRNYSKDQLWIPENTMEDYRKMESYERVYEYGCTEHYGD